MSISINTPANTAQTSQNGSMRFVWDRGFGNKASRIFNFAQAFVDSEVLRFCDPRTPMQSGYLKDSGSMGTVVGSGVVQYIAPYAKPQYYNTSDTRSYDANRGAHWFERGKIAEKARILEGARRIARGGF